MKQLLNSVLTGYEESLRAWFVLIIFLRPQRGSDLTSSTTTATFPELLNNLIGHRVDPATYDWLKNGLR